MWWIWLIVAVVVVVGILIAVLVLKTNRRDSAPGIMQMKRGYKRYEKHIQKQTAKIDGDIDESTRKIETLNRKAASVAKDRIGDHEKIRDADSWDDLDDVARDIEARR